ncbi:MAG: transglutaminase domain-containing protein [Chloroflexota bacterium]
MKNKLVIGMIVLTAGILITLGLNWPSPQPQPKTTLPGSLDAAIPVNASTQLYDEKIVSNPITVKETISYQVQETLTINNYGPGIPSKQNIWIALVRDVNPYQKVDAISINPTNYTLITDEYGNQYAEFSLDEMAAETSLTIEINYQVSINRLEYDLSVCEGELPQSFVHPELNVESNNVQIMDLAEQLSFETSSVCEQIRSFYDYIGDNLVYTYNGANWGAQAALGDMGADCTEYSSLLMALSRASGVPARYYEGLYYRGAEPEEGVRMEHSWVEIYFPGIGWVPIDPTFGRTDINRERYFAKMTPDHIIVSAGRNPSTLRGNSYWSHLYWAGGGTSIKVEDYSWTITPLVN